MTWYALADCNNFYASCERVFNPTLWGKPVVILSNNDGCIIARSNEAKALNIEMGAPYWKITPLLKKHNVKVCSSNYQLYGDMSARVMTILQNHCADVEVYSIDEAFLKLIPFKDNPEKRLSYHIDLRQKLLQGVGIPVCIGIAPTKTLAKLANHLAKKRTQSGVYQLTPNDPVLHEIPITKIWGVAKGYERRLSKIGVKTAVDLQNVNMGWIQKELGVMGVRLVKELQGFACYDLEPAITARKNIMVSRSFRRDVYELDELIEAISVYATRLCEKLRRYNQTAGQLMVFLTANPFKNKRRDGKKHFSCVVEVPVSTANTNEVIKWAIKIVCCLYEKGTNYKKAGIMASKLRPAHVVQSNLFTSLESHKKSKTLMKTIDKINAVMGKNTVYFSSCGHQNKQGWARKEQWSSHRFTTRWDEILTIKI